jgi:hypothetical protein
LFAPPPSSPRAVVMKVKFDTHKTFIKNQQQRLVSKSEIRKRKDRPPPPPPLLLLLLVSQPAVKRARCLPKMTLSADKHR